MTAKKNDRQKQAQLLRVFRKVHRLTGAFLFVFFFFVSISGLLLGWKKHTGGVILPKTQKGTSTDFKTWLPLDTLTSLAEAALVAEVSPEVGHKLDRIDVRQSKGILKFTFKDNFWEVQLDGATGEVLSVALRRSDFFENVHDGTVLDTFFGTNNGELKLIYSTTMGLALLTFTITGFWLWYGPKQMRKNKKRVAVS
ncbi:PepSY domain-containing protein [Chondrinema litorale]|uniref:PepSY domain-containing protein n=1 Tax=Chondrinema litorale TaxID=2994555 RepID=UPI002542FC4D|nr:PepSY domain-containing protein [Chondrinema litorale]UZR98305.1 PepSY domain-containing protein [Chondrinema litorale]